MCLLVVRKEDKKEEGKKRKIGIYPLFLWAFLLPSFLSLCILPAFLLCSSEGDSRNVNFTDA